MCLGLEPEANPLSYGPRVLCFFQLMIVSALIRMGMIVSRGNSRQSVLLFVSTLFFILKNSFISTEELCPRLGLFSYFREMIFGSQILAILPDYFTVCHITVCLSVYFYSAFLFYLSFISLFFSFAWFLDAVQMQNMQIIPSCFNKAETLNSNELENLIFKFLCFEENKAFFVFVSVCILNEIVFISKKFEANYSFS